MNSPQDNAKAVFGLAVMGASALFLCTLMPWWLVAGVLGVTVIIPALLGYP